MSTAKYAYHDNLDATGRMRRYRIWWGELPAPHGPVDVELVRLAPDGPARRRGSGHMGAVRPG